MSKKKYTIELSKEAYKDLKRLAIAVHGTEIKKKDVLEHVENVIFDSVIDLEDKLERKPKSLMPTQPSWQIREAEKVEKLKKFAKDNGIDDQIVEILEESDELRAYLIAKSFTNSLAIEKICEKFLPLYEGLEPLADEIAKSVKQAKEQLGTQSPEAEISDTQEKE